MIIALFSKGVQLVKIKNNFSEINLFKKDLKKKKQLKLLNKGKIVIKLQKLRSK